MLLQGFMIEETPVKMRKREQGESMHTGIVAPVKYMIKILYIILIIILSFKLKNLKNLGGSDV